MPRVKQQAPAKGWVVVTNNWTKNDLALYQGVFDKGVADYVIVGKEVGEKGTPHLQGFIHLCEKKRFDFVKKLFPRAHIEKAKGTCQENKVYCSKDKNFVEHGECPLDGATATKRNYQAAKDLAIQGKVDDIEANMYVPFYTTLKRIASDHRIGPGIMNELDNEWHWGPTGTGKSRAVHAKYPKAFIKPMNEWWDGYTDQEVVVIEDMDKYHVKYGYYLKLWGDHYPFAANYKGCSKLDIRPKKIIVTSNYSPQQIWSDESTYEPILRRFKLIEYGPGRDANGMSLTESQGGLVVFNVNSLNHVHFDGDTYTNIY